MEVVVAVEVSVQGVAVPASEQLGAAYRMVGVSAGVADVVVVPVQPQQEVAEVGTRVVVRGPVSQTAHTQSMVCRQPVAGTRLVQVQIQASERGQVLEQASERDEGKCQARDQGRVRARKPVVVGAVVAASARVEMVGVGAWERGVVVEAGVWEALA